MYPSKEITLGSRLMLNTSVSGLTDVTSIITTGNIKNKPMIIPSTVNKICDFFTLLFIFKPCSFPKPGDFVRSTNLQIENFILNLTYPNFLVPTSTLIE